MTTAPKLDLGMNEAAEAGPSLSDTFGGGISTDTLADDDELLRPDPDTAVSEPDFEPEPEPVEPEPLIAEPEPPLLSPISEPLAPPTMAPEGATFDLAAELRDALDDGPEVSASGLAQVDDDGFSAVFREFKKGVSTALDEGDHEAHWDLGIAYREMGLFEDAIGEFEVALASTARRIDGLHMIAVCALDLGRADDAAARLEEALASTGLRGGRRGRQLLRRR
jgi:tetratricopeptide (TPR) repeat protein